MLFTYLWGRLARRETPGRAALRPSRALLILSCCALLAGCSKDLDPNYEIPAPEPPVAEEPGRLSLSISIPGVSSSRPGTYALSPQDEGFVDDRYFNVLLFEADKAAIDNPGQDPDTKFTFVRYVPATEHKVSDTGAGESQKNYVRYFTIDMPQDADTEKKYFKVMIVANYPAAGDKEPPIDNANAPEQNKRTYWDNLLGNLPLADARKAIRFEQTEGEPWGDATLPLWGESGYFTSQVLRVATIPVLRAVARIDVGVNIGGANKDGHGNPTGTYDLTSADYNGKPMDLAGHTFELQSVRLYNAARSGYVAPAPGNLSPDRKTVTAPTTDGIAMHGQKRPEYAVDGSATNMIRRQIYLPETPNKTDADDQAFFIVVGGKYNNGPTTYYRVDFYDRTAKQGEVGTEHENYVKPTADNRYDILRNHAYVINILRVRGEGYTTPEEAALSEPVNMEVDVRSWDTGEGLSNVVTDGQYKLALSATQLRYHRDGTPQDLEIFTDFRLDDKNQGWKLISTNDPKIADNLKVSVQNENGEWTAVTPTAQDGTLVWTTGIAQQTGRVRLGLTTFDENNDEGLMERTLRLRVTAGRMYQDIELVQDVKNTKTLGILQQKFFFPKLPKANQSVVLKSSPTGATYYAVWTGADGKTYRANISDPDADDAGTVTGREGYIGGIGKVTADMLPKGFGHECKKGSHAEASCTAVEFFKQVAGSTDMFTLRPSDYDARHHSNVPGGDPTAPFSWSFHIEAYWDVDGTPDMSPMSVKLDVEQSYYETKWYPSASSGNDAPQLQDNILTVDWNATTATAYIHTTPVEMPWYFNSRTDEGNYSGREWVKNWGDLNGKGYTKSPSQVDVLLEPNLSLYPRTVTFYASSPADGFDKGSAFLKIEQQAGPVKLEIKPGVGVQNLPYDHGTKRYTLDFGLQSASALKALSVVANTDWYWVWRDDVTQDKTYPDGDPTPGTPDAPGDRSQEPKYIKGYDHNAATPGSFHIHRTHPYWGEPETTPASDNQAYVLSRWLGDVSGPTLPGSDNATTGNSGEKATEKEWAEAMVFRSPAVPFLSPNAISDAEFREAKNSVPLPGIYYTEVKLYPRHEQLDPAADTDGKIEGASKILRIQRTVPSYTCISMPFDGNDNVNLSNFDIQDYKPDGALVTDPNHPGLWNNQTMTISSNNRITVKLYHKTRTGQRTQVGSKTYYPARGYETVLTLKLPELKRDDNTPFIKAEDVPYNTENPKFDTYEIEVEGFRQKEKDGPDEKFTLKRTYYAGYFIEHPVTAQITAGGKYAYAGFDLLLDFSRSAYHDDQRIRIGRKKYHIGSYDSGSNNFVSATETQVGATEYTEYKLDGTKYQSYIKHTVPENDDKEHFYIYWVEYQPYGENEWKTVWSDGRQSATGTWTSFLFAQEAYSPDGLVFLENGPVVPAIPKETMNYNEATSNLNGKGSYATSWRNQGSMSQSGASITLNRIYTPMYEIYRRQDLRDGFTGQYFGITCQARSGNSDHNKTGNKHCNQSTVSAYQKLWGKKGHVFVGYKVNITGKHNCVGSRWHTRTVYNVKHYYANWISAVKCPDGHGISREHLQDFTSISPVYMTTETENQRGDLNLMIVRDAITARTGGMPSYNQALSGTKVP